MDDQLLHTALDGLERLIQHKRDELAGLEKTLTVLRGTAPDGSLPPPRSNEWTDIGITEASIRWLTEVGTPRGTREIADAIRDRGVRTRSKNFTATVFSTLTNNKKQFVRANGLWGLVPQAKAKKQA